MPIITRTERTTGVANPQVVYNASSANPQHFSWSPVTMLAYVKPATVATSGNIVDRPSTASTNGLRFGIASVSARVWFAARSSSGNLPFKYAADNSVVAGAWQHLAVTWNGSHLASGIALYRAGVGEQLADAGASSSDNGTTTALYPSSEDGARGLRMFETNDTATTWPFDGDVAYVAVWKAALTLEELRQAQANGPLTVRPTDLVLLRANGTDLSGYSATVLSEPAFGDGDLPPNLALDGATTSLQVSSLTFAPAVAAVSLPGAPVVPLSVSGLTFSPSVSTVAVPGGLNIQIYDDFERSSVNAALSSVTTDTDGLPLVILQQRLQTVTTMGTNRWLEPYAKVTGVLGLNPRFKIEPYAGGSGDNRNHQTWRSAMRGHYSYDGETWHVMQYVAMVDKLTWRANGVFTQDTVYVARSWPLSVTQVGQRVAALAAAHPTKVLPCPSAATFTPTLTTGFPAQSFIAEEVGAKTDELGRAVPATPFYGMMIDDPAYGPKTKTAVITAGIHSGEDIGELVLWEMLDVFLGSTPEAIALRQTTRLYVYPMMNPAGRYAGYWRGAPGSDTDPNREWLLSSPTHDCVTKGKAIILSDVAGEMPVAWAFDMHSTPYSNGPMNLSVSNDRPATVEFDRLVRLRYPSGGWADYSDRTVASADPATSDTLRGWQTRELGNMLGMLFETSDAYGPLSPTVMRPYAEASIGALADLQADGWFGDIEISLTGDAASLATATGNITTSISLAGSAASVAVADGVLSTDIRLDGEAVSQSSATGSLTAPGASGAIEGAAQAQATADGSITTAIELDGDAAATASAVGALAEQAAAAQLEGDATAQSLARATLYTPAVLSAARRRGVNLMTATRPRNLN